MEGTALNVEGATLNIENDRFKQQQQEKKHLIVSLSREGENCPCHNSTTDEEPRMINTNKSQKAKMLPQN